MKFIHCKGDKAFEPSTNWKQAYRTEEPIVDHIRHYPLPIL